VSVVGPRAIAALCVRCVAVLAVVNLAVLVVLQLADASGVEGAGFGLYLLALALLVAAVLTGVVGFPAGLLTARLLAGTTREWVHVVVFALVGAVLSVTLCAFVGMLGAVDWYALVAAAEGAVGAGGARWWSGRAHARRDTVTDEQGAALPWGRIAP
jgi:hypothetical protein